MKNELPYIAMIGFPKHGESLPHQPHRRREVYKAYILNLRLLSDVDYIEASSAWEDLEFNVRISGYERVYGRTDRGKGKWIKRLTDDDAIRERCAGSNGQTKMAWTEHLETSGPAVICKSSHFAFKVDENVPKEHLPQRWTSQEVCKKLCPGSSEADQFRAIIDFVHSLELPTQAEMFEVMKRLGDPQGGFFDYEVRKMERLMTAQAAPSTLPVAASAESSVIPQRKLTYRIPKKASSASSSAVASPAQPSPGAGPARAAHGSGSAFALAEPDGSISSTLGARAAVAPVAASPVATTPDAAAAASVSSALKRKAPDKGGNPNSHGYPGSWTGASCKLSHPDGAGSSMHRCHASDGVGSVSSGFGGDRKVSFAPRVVGNQHDGPQQRGGYLRPPPVQDRDQETGPRRNRDRDQRDDRRRDDHYNYQRDADHYVRRDRRDDRDDRDRDRRDRDRDGRDDRDRDRRSDRDRDWDRRDYDRRNYNWRDW